MVAPYLERFADLGARNQAGMRATDFTLERMDWLIQALGHPERRYPSIHVAGTNGKGSVAAFCAAVLQAAGYRVGAFTSPHVHSALDGIAVDGRRVTNAELEVTFATMQAALVQRDDWTQFEIVTALAYEHFARVGVQAAVIEVGLGGRLDATNVITPAVPVITPIDLDHTSILGDTLAQIAAEKAGIIKPGVPVVLAPQQAEARKVVERIAAERGAHLIRVVEQGRGGGVKKEGGRAGGQSNDVTYLRGVFDLSGQQFQVRHNNETQNLSIALLGAHQVANAATAYAALRAASERGLRVSNDAMRAGFAATRWPGRFEVVRQQPPVILDAAHSPHAAKALRQALDDYFPGRQVVLVLGISADKDLPGLLEPLQPRIARAVATQSTHPRAMPPEELRRRLLALSVQATAEADVGAAISAALAARQDDEIVLVCGSVFLVELARQHFHTA